MSQTCERIDAHHHLWQLGQFDYSWLDAPQLAHIRRTFLPDDLRPLMDAARVDRSIVVQTQHQVAENRWALALAEQHSWIAGVVGWVDLASNGCADQLAEFRDHPKFVGVRHVTQDEPDDAFLLRADVLRGLRVLERQAVPFDLLFYARHLPLAPRVAEACPELKLVIDHLSKPRIAQRELSPWTAQLKRAAEYPNVYCKLSGMITEASWSAWSVDDLRPFVETAVESFGPSRCMFGSDWPVCLVAGSYADVVHAFTECVDQYSAAEQAEIWGGTATRFYGLS